MVLHSSFSTLHLYYVLLSCLWLYVLQYSCLALHAVTRGYLGSLFYLSKLAHRANSCLKVTASFNSPYFPTDRCIPLRVLIWPLLILEGWKLEEKRKLHVIWICQTVLLYQLPESRNHMQNVKKAGVLGVCCGVGCESDMELWKCAWLNGSGTKLFPYLSQS